MKKSKNLKLAGSLIGVALVALGAVAVEPTLDSYDEKADHFELNINEIGSESSKALIHKNEPKVTISKWNGEAELSIKYNKVKDTGKKKVFTEDIEWKDKGGKEEVRVYPIQVDKDKKIEKKEKNLLKKAQAQVLTLEEGFEFEVIWNEKPSTTTVEFEFEGWENFDFLFQPPLTPEEIEEGTYQAESVINSFAIYHKTLKNHRIGGTNYATGKVGHIYRLKAIDANNEEIWIDNVSYNDGILTAIIDPVWADNATYPVIVDPTFGYTTIGGLTQSIEDQTIGSKASLTEDGTVTQISAHIRITVVNKNTQTAIYNYVSDTDAGTFVNQSSVATALIGSGWVNYTISQSLTAGDYFLFANSVLTGGVATLAYDNGAGFSVLRGSTAFGTWPDPFDETGNATRRYSIYATYSTIDISSVPRVQIFHNGGNVNVGNNGGNVNIN